MTLLTEESHHALAFARPFAHTYSMSTLAGGVQYPEFHPKCNQVSAAYPSEGTLIRPRDSSFEHLFVAAFRELGTYELGIHFGKKPPVLMDIVRVFGNNGHYFPFDPVVELGPEGRRRYEREIYTPDLGRVVRACNASEDIDQVATAVWISETEDPANTHKIVSPRDLIGYFTITTSEIAAARAYAVALTDIARKK